MVFGQKAYDNIMPWLRTHYSQKFLIQNVLLSHPQNIQWRYLLEHARNYIETFRGIMNLLGVDIPPLEGVVQLHFLITKKRTLDMMEFVEGFANSEVLEAVHQRTDKVKIARTAKVEEIMEGLTNSEEAAKAAVAEMVASVKQLKEMEEAASSKAAFEAAAAVSASAPRPRPSRTWTAEEDSIVMRTVLAEPADAAPYTRWSELITHLPGRTGKQARGRWTNILNPAIDRTPFGREDDLALLKGHSILGMRWVEISELVFQSRRSENQVKNRVRDGICLFTFSGFDIFDRPFDVCHEHFHPDQHLTLLSLSASVVGSAQCARTAHSGTPRHSRNSSWSRTGPGRTRPPTRNASHRSGRYRNRCCTRMT
jgi:hypothetical protein